MKAIKYIVALIFAAFIIYNSVYFKKLDEVKASKTALAFNAEKYASNFWNTKLMNALNQAVDLSQLISQLSVNHSVPFEKYSHALGIGNLRYFLVSGNAIISSVNEDDVSLHLQNIPDSQHITIATEFIFGNAVRDATGLIDINEFRNTMDFNNVSSEINRIIRAKVLPSFKANAKKGSAIQFIGAIELNKEHLDLSHIEIVPISINISKK